VYANTPDNHFFGISPLSIGTVGALLNFLVAYVVSMVTKAPPRDVVELVESIRIPRGAGKATGH
jgi:cation/acetate symporter